jgi:hypothetical protein
MELYSSQGMVMCSFYSTLMAGAMQSLSAIFAAIPAVVVAVYAAKISKRQTDVSFYTLRHDLFDRRYSVFEATQDFLASILCKGGAGITSYKHYKLKSAHAEFLFGDDVIDFLSQLNDYTAQLAVSNTEDKDLYLNEIQDMSLMIIDVFKPYLKIN